MSAMAPGIPPLRWERTVSAAPRALFQALAGMLRDRGFSVGESEPLPADDDAQDLRGEFHAEHDTVLDAARRLRGKRIMALALAIAMGALVVIVVNPTFARDTMSFPLVIATIVGGYGLSQLREPAQVRRRVVEALLERRDGELHLTVIAGLGRAEGRGPVLQWLPDEPVGIAEDDIDRLIAQTGRAEG